MLACRVQYPTTWLHELGHNLYMNHAGSYQDNGGGSMQVRHTHVEHAYAAQYLPSTCSNYNHLLS